MMKEILQKDIVQIKQLIKNVLGTSEYTDLSRMGGLTNRTYKMTLADHREYAVRIPGEGTEEMIIRSDEKISTELACSLGIDAKLLYFGKRGEKISEYIKGAQTMNAETIKEERRIKQVAEIFKKLHSCGVDTHIPFEVFEMAANYETIIYDHQVAMYDDYQEMKKAVMQIKEDTDAYFGTVKVPCHNDPLCENWIVDGVGKMHLVDWEYAGMNDGMWDLAAVSIEAGFDKKADILLLTGYLDKTPDASDYRHFLASKIYVDYLWTLWAKARVPYDGQPMEDWAIERYTRLKTFIQEYH